MLQTILKYLGVEIVKAIAAAFKDWLASYQENKKKKKREVIRGKREQLLISLEVARLNGDVAAVDRISNELSKLPID